MFKRILLNKILPKLFISLCTISALLGVIIAIIMPDIAVYGLRCSLISLIILIGYCFLSLLWFK
jgi:hypothetical protein